MIPNDANQTHRNVSSRVRELFGNFISDLLDVARPEIAETDGAIFGLDVVEQSARVLFRIVARTQYSSDPKNCSMHHPIVPLMNSTLFGIGSGASFTAFSRAS
jgi:hypothetical protein